MRHISFIIFFICSINFSYAQTTIKSKLTDHTNSPLILADILTTKNGEVIAETQTDELGNFNLIIDDSGTFILFAEYLGYDPFEKEIVLTNEKKTIQIPTIILQESPIALDNVIVTATTKVIEQKADRTVINVANSVLSDGNTALEILNKAPGVQVSDDGAISMRGKNGVRIMLNGKLSYLSESELATLLKGMPSNSIQNIELITNPSAKYDAEGNAGIINIILKKDARTGFNGYVNTFGTRGRKNRAGVGTLLNYQQEK